jgi:hypothetical protein
MSGKNFNLPRLATWLLRHARPVGDSDALTGDLIERFREGQTRGWFWRQVLIAFARRCSGRAPAALAVFLLRNRRNGDAYDSLEERPRRTVPVRLVDPAVALVAACSRVASDRSTRPGGIACLGCCNGDQPDVSLGQPVSDWDDQSYTDHPWPLSTRVSAPVVIPSCAGLSVSE